MKKALWVTCGPRGNAGDALLYDVTRRLFADRIDLDFRFVSDPQYIRRGDEVAQNVVIGPGGLLVQTNSSKHLHKQLAKQWSQFQRKTFHLWSTGILSSPSPAEVEGVTRITERAASIYVRARREGVFLREVAGVDAEWSPCASLFTDRLMGIERRTRDVVVVNFDEYLFREDNIAEHPLRRFKSYAESLGLEVRSMVNASGDSNRLMLDLFPVIEADQPYLQEFLSGEPSGRAFHDGFNAAMAKMPSFGERYVDCRFAFGKRLHGWLPFLAFDTPAAFIGMHARRGMPRDYFRNHNLLCAVPRRRGIDAEHLEQMADAMIGKLSFFTTYEDRLKKQIAERREELWEQLQVQADAFASRLV